MARTGRRPGESGSRDAILTAARTSFAEAGYDGATIRGIARGAGVDPALVHHFFGTKEQIFVAAMELPLDPAAVLPELLAGPADAMGERVVRFFLSVWDSPVTGPSALAVLRSAIRHERAAALLRGFVGREVISRLAAQVDRPDPQLRATLVGSQLVGLAMARYVIRIEPLASAAQDAVVAAVAPTVQRYLTADLHLP